MERKSFLARMGENVGWGLFAFAVLTVVGGMAKWWVAVGHTLTATSLYALADVVRDRIKAREVSA